ncbi:hypothetical protein V8B97DRAFT_2003423 [Scleroderma yunnanense]
MSYSSQAVAVVRQEGFQLPSPANSNASNSPSDPAPMSPPPPDATPAPSSAAAFMHHNLPYVHDTFRKFPSHHHSHQHAAPAAATAPIDLTDELASLIDPHPHASSQERSTHSPNASYDEPYRHNIFDISAPPSTHLHHHHHHHHHSTSSSSAHPFTLPRAATSAADMYPSADIALQAQAHFNNSGPLRFESQQHPDPQAHLGYRHTPSPSHRSRSRSRAPSVGPTRSAAVARRDRRASSISSHVSSTSPPPRPHPHAIVIPGRGSASAAMGGFFVPGQPQTQNIAASAVHGGEFSLPTPDSLSHSFGFPSGNHIQNNHAHSQFAPYPAPSSPYYPYNSVPPPRPGSPTGLGISPSDVETLGTISIGNGTVNNLNMSTAPAGTPTSIHPSNLPANSNGILPSAPLSRSISSSMSGKTVTAPNGSITGTKQLDPGTDNHLSEKKKRRRESHNAVERRRRDNINERIGELAGLIPGVLFECDAPLVVPTGFSTTPTASSPTTSFAVGIGDELFGMNLLGESGASLYSLGMDWALTVVDQSFRDDDGMHVLPSDGMDGLPDLPEECVGVGTLKKDPTEDVIQGQGTTGNGNGTHASSSLSANGTIPTNGTTSTMSGEQTTIKANKGMILRKSVEYIRYLQQLVSIQASRGRDLEERNRTLEQQLAALQGSLGDTHSTTANIRGNGDVSRTDGHRDVCLEDQYEWGAGAVDMDIEDVHQRTRPHHQRSASGYNKVDHREGLECLKEVELEFEEGEQRRGRQRERGAPERTAMGRSVSRVRSGIAMGIGREGGDMEI